MSRDAPLSAVGVATPETAFEVREQNLDETPDLRGCNVLREIAPCDSRDGPIDPADKLLSP